MKGVVFANDNVYEMCKEKPVLVPGHQRAAALGLQLLLVTLHIHMSAENTTSVIESSTHYNPSPKAFPKRHEIEEIDKDSL